MTFKFNPGGPNPNLKLLLIKTNVNGRRPQKIKI
jgi:hypothetical protein